MAKREYQLRTLDQGAALVSPVNDFAAGWRWRELFELKLRQSTTGYRLELEAYKGEALLLDPYLGPWSQLHKVLAATERSKLTAAALAAYDQTMPTAVSWQHVGNKLTVEYQSDQHQLVVTLSLPVDAEVVRLATSPGFKLTGLAERVVGQLVLKKLKPQSSANDGSVALPLDAEYTALDRHLAQSDAIVHRLRRLVRTHLGSSS